MNPLYASHIKDSVWSAYQLASSTIDWKGRMIAISEIGVEMITLFFQTIKNGCVNAYHKVVAKGSEWIKFKPSSGKPLSETIKNFFSNTGERLSHGVTQTKEWLGRGWTSLKSGQFLQDKRVAAISLIVVTILLFKIGLYLAEAAADFIEFHVDHDEDDMSAAAACISFGGCVLGGVALFSKVTHSPLSKLAIAAITLATCAAMLFYEEG